MAVKHEVGNIFQEYKNKVFRLALSLSRNKDDAEDITQNTFLKIIDNISRFQGRSKLSTWIYRIAFNEALQFLRKRKRVIPASLGAELRDGSACRLPDERAIGREMDGRIKLALERMPIKYRMAVLLKDYEELPVSECSQILGIGESSFKSRLHRGREAVKEALSDYYRDRVAKLQAGRKCPMCTEFIYNYIRDKLPPGKKSAFNKHISGCSPCKAFLGGYEHALRLTRALQCKDIPAALQSRIRSFIK